MITIRTCHCGRALDALAWAQLPAVCRGVKDGIEYQRRRCRCGAEHDVAMHEDDAAKMLGDALMRARYFYSHARMCLASVRLARASQRGERLDQFRTHRAAARAERETARLAEQLLASIYRARELRNPKLRLGRNLTAVKAAGHASRAGLIPGQGRESPTSGVHLGGPSCGDAGAPHGVDKDGT